MSTCLAHQGTLAACRMDNNETQESLSLVVRHVAEPIYQHSFDMNTGRARKLDILPVSIFLMVLVETRPCRE